MTTTTRTTKKVEELSIEDATRAGLIFKDIAGDLRGYCYCCGRIGFKLNKHGQLSRHGFTRPRWMGYTEGACYGTRHTPEQTLLIAIENCETHDRALDALLATDLIDYTMKAVRSAVREHMLYSTKHAGYIRDYPMPVYLRSRLSDKRKGAAIALRALRSGDWRTAVYSNGYHRDASDDAYIGAYQGYFSSPTGNRVKLEADKAMNLSYLARLIDVRDNGSN